jgi:hypothetical protein
MWLSNSGRAHPAGSNGSGLGKVTIGGNPAGVFWCGERRNLPVISPGGFWWKPKAGQEVLLLKTDTQSEGLCVAGAKQGDAPAELLQGEVLMGDEKAWIKTTEQGVNLNGKTQQTGDFSVTGNTALNGKTTFGGTVYIGSTDLESYIKNIINSTK